MINPPDEVYFNMLKTPKDVARWALEMHAQLNYPAEQYPHDRPHFAAILYNAGYDVQRMPSDIINQLFFAALWVKYGMPVYRPTLDLAAGLAMTDCSDVRGEDWKLPYGAFIIHVPYDLWTVRPPPREGFEGFEGMPIAMIGVQIYTASTGRDMIDFSAWSREGAGVFSRWNVPRDDELLGDWIANTAQQQTPLEAGRWQLDPYEQDVTVALWRLVINLCLYVTDRGPGRPEPRHTTKAAKRRQTRRGGAAAMEPEVWILGKEVHLDKEVLDAARARATGTREEWHVASRTIVQGHHKMQVHGPGRTLRKRIWIEPYARGRGPRLTHMYVVGPEDE